MIEIKQRGGTDVVLYTAADATSVKEAVLSAIKEGILLTRANLAGANLADANLVGANLARANLAGANLADADLADAYLAGANLTRANLTRANLVGADLVGADFAGANLADANLADANLVGANLAGANLADANLTRAYLAGATMPVGFDTSTTPALSGEARPPREWKRMTREERMLDYRARHPEVPVVDKLDTKIRDAIDHGDLKLEMGSWHTCGTTHCRGGSAIHIAGDGGYALEKKYGPERAARMIYLASTGRAPHFFATNENALADIRRRAEEENAGV